MKVINRIMLLLTLVFGLVFSACEKILLNKDPADQAAINFEYLWQDVNDRYAFFNLKSIDWEAVKGEYQSQVYEGMPEEDLFNILAEMLFELQDGHVNLTSSFNRSRNWDWFQDYPFNYNQNIISRHYLGRDFHITGPFQNQIINSVLYVNYRSFSNDIAASHLNFLLERAKGLKGIIIDVRSNGGGSLGNAYRLAATFTTEPYEFARQRMKTGPGENDFSSWDSMEVEPREGPQYEGKVVVLINRGSYSASTFFAQMMRENPRVQLIGSTTGGGGGVPVFGELPNGWTYRFSATQTQSLDGHELEAGIPADIEVEMDPLDEQQGIDSILEFALESFQ